MWNNCHFSGWGNKIASEKNLHHFSFWHPPLFNFYIVIFLPGTKEIFLPDGLKRFLLQLASPLTIWSYYIYSFVLVKCIFSKNYQFRFFREIVTTLVYIIFTMAKTLFTFIVCHKHFICQPILTIWQHFYDLWNAKWWQNIFCARCFSNFR